MNIVKHVSLGYLEASFGYIPMCCRCRYPQPNTGQSSHTLKEELGEVIEGPEEDENFTERSRESTNLEPWELSKTEPQTNQGMYVGWNEHICSRCAAQSPWLPCLALVGEVAPSLTETWSTQRLEVPHPHRAEREEAQRQGLCEEGPGRGATYGM